MTDGPKPQDNKKNKSANSLKALSEEAKKHQKKLGRFSQSDSLRLGIPSQVAFDKITRNLYPLKEFSDMMAITSSRLQNLFPRPSIFSEIEGLSKSMRNIIPVTIHDSLYQNSAVLNSILGPQHSFFERQSYLVDSVSKYLSSSFLFSKNSYPELYGFTEDWKDLFSKGILGSTLTVFNQPDLQISDLEKKIENTLSEEEILLENKEFTNELRETFDKEYSSGYKLTEWIEKESTFLFYKLMHKYGLSVQAARNFVFVVMWASGLFISILAKELITSKEDRKPNITINKTYNNPVYNTYVTDTVIIKVPVYRRGSDKTKRHAIIHQDSIVSIFKQKGAYSLVETAIDSSVTDERRIVRGWIKSDSLKNNSSK